MKAEIGENVAVILKDDFAVNRGMILSDNEHLAPVQQFSSQTFWAEGSPLKRGDQVRLECRTQEGPVAVEAIFDEGGEKPLPELQTGDLGLVQFRALELLYLDQHALSRFVIHRQGQMNGCGVVVDISYEN